MKTQKYDFTTLKVPISKQKRERAKAFAKSKGFTFGSWIVSLIDKEMEKPTENMEARP